MAEEIMRKLSDVQAWLTDHGARLDAITERLLDQETRIITLEETVAGLIIPRVLPFRSSSPSSPHEYKVYVEPVVGMPLTVQVEAETDREAIEKAERMFNTPLAKTEILSKALTARERAVEELRLVAKVKPRKIEGISDPVKVELTLLTCPFCRRSAVYPVYYWNKRRLTDAIKCYACNEIFSLKKEGMSPARSNPIKLKCKLCGKTLPTRSVKEYMEHLEREHAIFYPELVERYFYEFVENPSPSSRWVLELYPDEIPVWTDFIRILEAQPLSTRERSFMRSLDYYIRTERKITVPMLAWLYSISSRVRVAVPEVAYPRR